MGESNKTTGVVNTYVLSDCGKYYNVTFRNSDKVEGVQYTFDKETADALAIVFDGEVKEYILLR